MDFYGIKEDGIEVGTVAAGVLVGAAVAKKVVDIDALNSLPAPEWVKPLVPIAVGIAVHRYGRSYAPQFAPAVAAGMVAVGLGKLIGAAARKVEALQPVAAYTPFAGVDTYDTGALGYSYGAGVDRYMMAGAPTQVQSLAGAPVQVQAFGGLGSTIVGGAPLSASLQ